MANTINIPTDLITDPELSAKDRGVYAWIAWALKEGRNPSLVEMEEAGLAGVRGVSTSIAKLEELGYLTRTRTRDERGYLSHTIYKLHSKRIKP
jgi:hypothetical protein